MVSEKSLKNLEKGKPFTADCKEVAREAQEKSVAKRKENKLMREVAAEKLLKRFDGTTFQDLTIEKIMDYCRTEKADPEIVLKILTFLRDTAGQKPKDEPQVINIPVINIKGL